MDGYTCKHGQIKIKPPPDHDYWKLVTTYLKVYHLCKYAKHQTGWNVGILMAIAESEYHSNDKLSGGFGAEPKKTFQVGILVSIADLCVFVCVPEAARAWRRPSHRVYTHREVCASWCASSVLPGWCTPSRSTCSWSTSCYSTHNGAACIWPDPWNSSAHYDSPNTQISPGCCGWEGQLGR